MGFSCGIVGLPNVGKSTLFNALTTSHVPAENFPFCTKDKNVGIVAVLDDRLKQIAQLAPREKLVPTTLEMVDIAGLVKDSSKGEGLGNQFLGTIAEVDAIAHVVRCFQKTDVVHIYGEIDPIRDIEIVQTELLLRDLDILQKWHAKSEKAARTTLEKKLKESVTLVKKFVEALQRGTPIHTISLSQEEQILAKELKLGLVTAKPVLYVANIGESDFKNRSPVLQTLEQWCQQKGELSVKICSQIEQGLAELSSEERREFIQELGFEADGLVQLIQKGYQLLGLVTFFTIGDKEIRAWTVPKGTLAPQAAGKIHTDFERGFIAAETVSFKDFITFSGEHGVREHGKLRLEGKSYVVQDGDIIKFRFSV